MSTELPDEALARADRSTLGRASVQGVRWTAGGRMVTEVVSLASSVVLARLLLPAEFGVAVIALIVIALAETLAYEGFGSVLVQRKDADVDLARTAAGLALIFGLVAGAATFVTAPLVATITVDGVEGPLRIASLAFLIAGFGAIPRAQLQRQLDFRRLGIIEVTSLFVTPVVAIATAIAGLGAEALVLGGVAGRIATAGLSFLAAPRIRLSLRPRLVAQILGFGASASAAGFLHTAKKNADYGILAAQLGPAALGFYYRAFQLGVEYQSKISTIVTRISFPIYSMATDIGDMFALRTKIARVQMGVIVPVLVTYMVCAPILVPFVFGERWEPSVAPSQVLTITALVELIGMGNGPLLTAAGRPGLLAWANLAQLVAFAAMILLVGPLGLMPVAIAVSTFNVAWTLGTTWLLLGRALGLPVRVLVNELLAPLVCAFPLLLFLPLVESQAFDQLPAFVILPVLFAVAGLSYPLMLRVFFPALGRELLGVGRRLAARTPHRAAT